MKKQLKNLIIVSVLLVVLIAGYLIAKNLTSSGETDSTTSAETEAYTVANVNSSTINAIDITVKVTGDSTEIRSMHFDLKEDATGWTWDGDTAVPLDNTVFAKLVTALNEAVSGYRLTDVATGDLASYGLDSPFIEIVFGNSDGTESSYKVGSYNGFSSSYYFADAADQSTVYTISDSVVSELNKTVYDFVLWDTLPEITSSGIKTITVEKGTDTIVYSYLPSGDSSCYTSKYTWFMSVNGGTPVTVSSALGDKIASALTSAEFTDCIAYRSDTDYKTYGLDAPAMFTVAYTYKETVEDSTAGTSTEVTKNDSLVLLFGSETGDGRQYVKLEDSGLVYTISDSSVYSTLIEADEFAVRPSEILNFSPENSGSVKLTADGKTLEVSFTKEDASYTYKDVSGAELNYDKYSDIIDALNGTSATSDSKLIEADAAVVSDTAVFTATFDFGDGKTGELKITPYTSSYYKVSFLDRTTQLITADDAQSILDTFAAYFG